MPSLPQPPPREIADGSDYAPVAQQIASSVTTVSQGPDYDRAQHAFARLAEVASTRGLIWKLYVYASAYDEGYGVPDGSIFISQSLIEHLDSDDELTAVLAHLMAHERYGHSRNTITRANQAALEAGVASPVVAFLSLGYAAPYALMLGGFAIATPFMSYATKLGIFGYLDSEELEADALATQYLAQLHIAPGTVVNALHDSIRHAPSPGDFESRWFGSLHDVESSGPNSPNSSIRAPFLGLWTGKRPLRGKRLRMRECRSAIMP